MNQRTNSGETKSLAEIAVKRRQDVRRIHKLSDAAKLLFDDLTDLCFLDRFSVAFGVVRIGKPLLAERLGCSVASITRRQKRLREQIWTRTGWYQGHEITIWFLRGIADGQLELDRFTEGATTMPRTKIAPRTKSLRNGHGHFCKSRESADLLEKEFFASSDRSLRSRTTVCYGHK